MKIGVCVDNLGPSQLSFFLIRSINEWLKEKPQNDAIVFYDNLEQPCVRPEFALMQSIDLAAHNGHLLATSFMTARKVLSAKGPKSRSLYVNDLEWMRRPGTFSDWSSVYGHPDLTLFARSQDHADVIANAWNRTVLTCPDFSELFAHLERL